MMVTELHYGRYSIQVDGRCVFQPVDSRYQGAAGVHADLTSLVSTLTSIKEKITKKGGKP
jgi:hypothetical protein